MPKITFPLSTSPGDRATEGAGRLINCFAEPRGEGAQPGYVLKRAPGAAEFADVTEEIPAAAGFRGGIQVASTFYAATEDVAYTVTAGGAVAEIDALDGDDKLFWASNNKDPTPDIVVVGAAGVFEVDDNSVTPFADEDVGSPNAVCFLDGYFFFTYGDGTCQASGINAVTIDTNDVATAESNPDGLSRPVPWRGQLLLCGPKSIEVWAGNPVNDTGFPFSRVTVVGRGLIGAHAIAGHEDGFKDALIFVGDDNRVYQLNNYEPVAISPPDLDRLIEAVADKTELEAMVYKAGGHSFWQLSSAAWTWVFNVNNQKWHERRSYLQTRSRLTQSVNAFGHWLCGDTETASVLQITNTSAREMGDPFVVRAESLPMARFPNRIRVPRADFDFATGVGVATGAEPVETVPQVGISWSDDGGQNWSVPLLRGVGPQAKTRTRVGVINAGMSGPAGRKWAVEMSDPVHFGLMGGEQSAQLGTK